MEVSRFHSKIFCLRVPKNFERDPFCDVFQKVSGKEKVYRSEGGYQKFPRKIFFLTVPKIFVAEPFFVSLISGIEKIYASEVYVTIFRRNLYVS